MTRFSKENLIKSGNILFYSPTGDAWDPGMTFVARFKHRGPFTMAAFRNELIKNHTVDSFFDAIDAGETPLGYMRKHAADWYYSRLEKKFG